MLEVVPIDFAQGYSPHGIIIPYLGDFRPGLHLVPIPAAARHEQRYLGGIIPAWVGSSTLRASRMTCAWDHPRVGGEQELPFAALVLLTGSSPRVRGAVAMQNGYRCIHGIIPARAGSSQPYSMSCRCLGDHPRVCGEQLMDEIKLKPCPGSSPRVRGAVNGAYGARCHVGIIPARAGSRPSFWPAERPSRDHPRVCGEQVWSLGENLNTPGSSPRVRGAVLHPLYVSVDAGIIPACAGSSWPSTAQASRHWDHPRVCGEQADRRGRWRGRRGSSPRVRGAAPRSKHGIQ